MLRQDRGNPATLPQFFLMKPDLKGLDKPSEQRSANENLVEAMAEAISHAEFPDLKSIICAFTRKVGGAEGVARMLLREYRAAKDGSMIRSMILQMILQGSKTISAKEQSRDASMITDEDLEKEMTTLLDNAQKAGKYASGPGITPTA